ncbi:hypothetical protein V4F39_26795 [Aquincola sp. MAHUQ-54]|uniref:Uncharacterized protein n=1 Tax=Aquincola agrisoli TaxID=3119538 RepID=A0AAW9QPD3_9BURK
MPTVRPGGSSDCTHGTCSRLEVTTGTGQRAHRIGRAHAAHHTVLHRERPGRRMPGITR